MTKSWKCDYWHDNEQNLYCFDQFKVISASSSAMLEHGIARVVLLWQKNNLHTEI
jgi:hypothetical protein